MLRFDESPPPRTAIPKLSGPHTRLWMLVAMLCAVVVAMGEIQSPRAINALGRVFGTGYQSVNQPLQNGVATPQSQSLSDAVISADQLALIRDNSFFRNEETEPWFTMLAFLNDEKAIEATPASRISYAQLVDQPDTYRGRWVSIAGTVKDVKSVTPAENSSGIDRLYRLIVQPHGGSVWPITLYSLQDPQQALDKDFTASGLFFKNQSYRWQEGLGITPVVLTKSIKLAEGQRIVRVPTNDEPISLTTVALISLFTSTALVLFFIALQRSGQRR